MLMVDVPLWQDAVNQPYQSDPESDPEGEAPEEAQTVSQEVSEWLVCLSMLLFLCCYSYYHVANGSYMANS